MIMKTYKEWIDWDGLLIYRIGEIYGNSGGQWCVNGAFYDMVNNTRVPWWKSLTVRGAA